MFKVNNAIEAIPQYCQGSQDYFNVSSDFARMYLQHCTAAESVEYANARLRIDWSVD